MWINGVVEIDSGVTDYGDTVFGSGIQEITGGAAWYTHVISGGHEDVEFGGTSVYTTVYAGSFQNVDGTAWDTTLTGSNNSQAVQHIFSDGVARTTTIDNLGIQYDEGMAYGTTINAGGIQSVLNGGDANTTFIYSGGKQYLFNGSDSYATTIYNGGTEFVESKCYSHDTTIDAGGFELVDTGGNAWSTTVNGFGLEIGKLAVQNGGQSRDTVVNQFGEEDVRGMAEFTTVNALGIQDVNYGGNAVWTTINAGGKERVHDGSTANGVAFGGPNALLDLDNANCAPGLIAGFKSQDQIDLRSLQYSPGGITVGFDQSTGVLTLSDGVVSDKLSLMGQYTASNFSIGSDGHGGTMITEVGPQLPGALIANPLHVA
jgi:autotransporter passenger strand-loop-strand repeat protein